jgi:HEAT repeat protein
MTTDCVTSYAANALVNIGSDAAIAIGDILLDENRNATIRMNAAYALHAMEKKAYPSLPFVVAATTVKDKNVRRLAVGLLPRIAPKSIESRRTLLGALADQNSEVVIEAASALFSMDNRNVISVPVLVEQLEKGDARAKASSADALGKIGTAAKSAIPSLAEAAKSTDVGTTISCLSAMIDIGHFTPEVFNAAFLANQHNNHNVRALAKTLLEKIKAKS